MSDQAAPPFPYPTPLEQGQRLRGEEDFARQHGFAAEAAPAAAVRHGEDSIARAYDLVAGLEQYAGPAMAAPIRLAIDALAADCREASWTSDRRFEELQRLRLDLRRAAITVAQMHEAAVGSQRAPITEEVEDVARLRLALESIHRLIGATSAGDVEGYATLVSDIEKDATSALYPPSDVDTDASAEPSSAGDLEPAPDEALDAAEQPAPPAGPATVRIDWDQIGRNIQQSLRSQAARR